MYILLEYYFCTNKEFWNGSQDLNGDFVDASELFYRSYGELSVLKQIYIRSCYRDLDQIVESYSTAEDVFKIIVTGTPGVGKSTFLLHELLKGRERKRKVIVQVGHFKLAFMEGRVLAGRSDQDLFHLLGDSPQTVFLFDPAGTKTGLPQVPRAFTVVFASMFEGNFACIAKAVHVRLYMPVWSLGNYRLVSPATPLSHSQM